MRRILVSSEKKANSHWKLKKKNVFRATRYKTTSLPAALNQARRIDTLGVFLLYGACKLVLYIVESTVLHCYVMKSRLKYRISMWHNRHVIVWHFSRDIVCLGRLFRYLCFWPLSWKLFMESVLHLKNHDIMPDTVLYIYYHTVFIYFFCCWVFYHTQMQCVEETVVNEEWYSLRGDGMRGMKWGLLGIPENSHWKVANGFYSPFHI